MDGGKTGYITRAGFLRIWRDPVRPMVDRLDLSETDARAGSANTDPTAELHEPYFAYSWRPRTRKWIA